MTMRMTLMLLGSLLMVALPCGVLLRPAAAQPAKAGAAKPGVPPALKGAVAKASQALVARYGAGERGRIDRGLRQVAELWRPADGDAAAFTAFVTKQFVPSGAPLKALLGRFEEALEQVDGHFVEIGRELRRRSDLDLGPLLEIDKLTAGLDPGAHLVEDLFQSRIAFVALLNFPLTTLAERLRQGSSWSRDDWAGVRLAQRFYARVPGAVQARIAAAGARSELYIAEYNIWVHHVVERFGLPDAQRPFAKGLRLISHWNLRDELKSHYGRPGALARQRLIAKVMERIVDQSIPRVVIDNPRVDWNPYTNEVRPAPPATIEANAPAAPAGGRRLAEREPDTRYARLLDCFHAVRAADPYSPVAPTHIARKFDVERELPEARVEALLKEVLTSPLVPRLAKVLEGRLGRKLEPFDIWYQSFKPHSKDTEADLDAITRRRYPTAAAFHKDIPRILVKLGFTPARARYLAQRIVVDPSRGAGHALGAARRQDQPHLRTRVGKTGMTYKGYNIAVHELGHNVEQVFSLYDVDHTLLQGVPNTAFTEAIAFVFQGRDLELLGRARPDATAAKLHALNTLWMTYEIAGVALVDMGIWHWMYAHPQATPAQLREATLHIARDVWNRYYAPVFGRRDVTLLAVYSHIISYFLYVPDYPLGHLIAFQIEEHLKGRKGLGAELERMTRFGRVTPDAWMVHATGKPVSAAPLLQAAAAAMPWAEAGGKGR
jgi:hypothetical protein